MPLPHADAIRLVSDYSRAAVTQVAADGEDVPPMGIVLRGLHQVWMLSPNPRLPKERVVSNMFAALNHAARLLDADAVAFGMDTWLGTEEINPETHIPWTVDEIKNAVREDPAAVEQARITESVESWVCTRNGDATHIRQDYRRPDVGRLAWSARIEEPIDVDKASEKSVPRYLRNIMWEPTQLQELMRKDVRLVNTSYSQTENDQQALQMFDSYGLLVVTASDV